MVDGQEKRGDREDKRDRKGDNRNEMRRKESIYVFLKITKS